MQPYGTVAGQGLGRGGRRGTGRGGSRGRRGGGGDEGDRSIDDLERLARMLERLRGTLGSLAHDELGVLNATLKSQFVRTWPGADERLVHAIDRLRALAIPTPSARSRSTRLRRQLGSAGLTGSMLLMKETSLDYYLNPIDRIVAQPLTGQESWGEKAVRKLLTWTKPGFKVMNSILGSLLKAFPGMDVVKEFKEHVEASYEVADALGEERE